MGKWTGGWLSEEWSGQTKWLSWSVEAEEEQPRWSAVAEEAGRAGLWVAEVVDTVGWSAAPGDGRW